MKTNLIAKIAFLAVFVGVLGFTPLCGQERRTAHLDVNLIIDGSAAVSPVFGDAVAWLSGSLVDQKLQAGDSVTIWNAGNTAQIVYSETIKSDADRESVKKAIQAVSPAGDTPDFAGALREAASRRRSGISYTVLISAAASALSPGLQGPAVRFSKTEEFRGWRTWVIGLGLDAKVRQAASAYLGN